MRPADPPPPPADAGYVAELAAIAAEHGIQRTGIAPAGVLHRARTEMLRRREAGLHDGMEFTYRDVERSTDPGRAVRGARAVFVGARSYLTDEPAPPVHRGPMARVARYAQLDHYAPLREGLWAVAHRLRADGWKAVAYADDNSIVDREVAHLAGIGWFGKNANLLLHGAGSWFVLGCVVTTAPLPPSPAPAGDGCGTCTRCIPACPTAAIVAPGVIDAARCLAWVLQKPGHIPLHLRTAVGDRLYGCDECQEACPPTVRLGAKVPAPQADDPSPVPEAWVAVLELLDATDHEILARWGRWYLADRDPRWLRRNALVVLGNAGAAAAGDERVGSTLGRYRSHPDPVLRSHADWAAHRLGLAS